LERRESREVFFPTYSLSFFCGIPYAGRYILQDDKIDI
jgi:hypothetical protein